MPDSRPAAIAGFFAFAGNSRTRDGIDERPDIGTRFHLSVEARRGSMPVISTRKENP